MELVSHPIEGDLAIGEPAGGEVVEYHLVSEPPVDRVNGRGDDALPLQVVEDYPGRGFQYPRECLLNVVPT